MMYEIPSGDDFLSSKLVHGYSDMMFSGIVAGNNPGKIWVDDPDNPVSAIVWSDGLECFQFMGRYDNESFNKELGVFINDVLLNFLKEKKLDFFEYASDEEGWHPVILNALTGREIKCDLQHVYRLKTPSDLLETEDRRVMIPELYCLHAVDTEFIAYANGSNINCVPIGNPEFITGHIEQFWGSAANYLKLGFGYATVCDDKITSFAISSSLYGKTSAIDVETLEQHRRKGLAGILANTLIKKLCSEGYDVWWDCMESNIASRKTAEKAGLVFDHIYTVFWFDI